MKTDETNLEQNLDQKCGCDEVLQNEANLDANHAENMAKNNVDCAHSSAQTDEQISTTNSDEIVKIQSELDEITDKFVRAQADFANIKKRLERENSENLEYANMKFAKDLLPIKFADSSKLTEGDIVFAIGNPFGVGGTITQGIISALNKNNIGLNRYENFIQTDASINPGNSGGALVDSRGALIGINSAILSRSGGNNGIGFAIPSNMVQDVTKALVSDGKIERGFIGVLIADLTSDQKEIYTNKQGALISKVEGGKPADKAGLKIGDLVIKIDDQEIKSANDLKNYIGSKKPDSKLKITYERGGEIKTTDVKLIAQEAITITTSDTDGGIAGLSVKELDSKTRTMLKIDDDIKGIIVSDVKNESDADDYGFMKNDIIIQVGQKEIKSISDFKDAIKQKGKKLVWVIRGKIPQGIVIK